jgi:hypothetical protein
VLRVLLVLHRDFAAEVGAWAPAAQQLRARLERVSFPSLWPISAFFPNRETVELIEQALAPNVEGVIVPFEPHLRVLATKLSLPRPDQLSLFPPMVVSR